MEFVSNKTIAFTVDLAEEPEAGDRLNMMFKENSSGSSLVHNSFFHVVMNRETNVEFPRPTEKSAATKIVSIALALSSLIYLI